MHKTVPVAELTLDDDLGVILSADKLYKAEHLPVGIPVKGDLPDYAKLTRWWKSRSIPASRSGLRQLLEKLNVPMVQALVKECYGLSLSDQYWIRPENSDLKWNKINFFFNTFSEDIGTLLFGGKIASGKPDLISPDSTSDGNLKKRWKIIDGQRCLIKGGSNPYHQEPLNEVLASVLLQKLNTPHVDYTLLWEGDYPYSVCADFITPDTELVTAFQICETQPFHEGDDLYAHFMNCSANLGIPDIQDSIDRMLTTDFLIANSDRHFGNFGAVRNAETLEWIGPAPIFDNGTSLWCNTVNQFINPDADLESVTFYQKHRDQITLVTSFDWLDFSAVDGIADDFAEILASSPYIDEERKGFLCSAIARRVELLDEFVQIQEQTGGMKLT